MKITVIKRKGNKETMVWEPLDAVVRQMAEGEHLGEIRKLREVWHLMHPRKTDEGVAVTNFDFKMTLPRLCFAAELARGKGEPTKADGRLTTASSEQPLKAYNGLIVLEANNLSSYDEAIGLRDKAARLPQTLLAFLGASGRSVKVVCRGELLPDNGGGVPTELEQVERFHRLLYRTARQAYNAQLDITLDAVKPLIHRTVYMTADPDLVYRPHAVPFYIDLSEETRKSAQPQTADREKQQLDYFLMPGRTLKRTWILNFQFVLNDVLGQYFELPDEEREAELVMRVAQRCLTEGIPQEIGLKFTLLHPVLNHDRLLVETTFANVYAVQNMEQWAKRNRVKPLKSVPEDTLLMMKTDIFLHTHYEMRKNVMTGVAQYRENNGEDNEFQDLDDEARNEMTMRAKELGLKSWDRDIARFIDSPRIERYDPVNDWLDHLPQWDGEDRIEALAERVPTNQPHWQHYLHTWLLGMVAHWQGRQSLTGNALVPLLIGRQGCGKSSFCRILLPKELRDYYNDRINFKNETDLNLGLTSFALINIDEFDKTTQRQQVLLKYLLSTADVKFRPPYGKTYKQYRRYASFIGTTNQLKPLTDPTGSRRFVCVEITDMINFDDTLDHRQLYAQLKQEIADGQRYWLEQEEIEQLIEENARFQRIDSLAEMISELFRKPEGDERGRWWSNAEVLEMLQRRYGKTTLKNVTPEKVGNTLSRTGFGFQSKHASTGTKYHLMER